jgi:DinB superfamily
MDRAKIVAEMREAAADFRLLLDTATSAELRRESNGTKWTNEQLLFHMLFGYLVVRRLLVLVRFLARLPDAVSRVFAAALNAGTEPFHVINYVGSLAGARVLGHAGMERLFDRVVNGLAASLLDRSDGELARGMHFPVGWDPYFRDYMTLADVYHYATQHYRHHRHQLTLARVIAGEAGSERDASC